MISSGMYRFVETGPVGEGRGGKEGGGGAGSHHPYSIPQEGGEG